MKRLFDLVLALIAACLLIVPIVVVAYVACVFVIFTGHRCFNREDIDLILQKSYT
jgi:lipopolysaccharide/colanic/teichoic acid biosynthesis glycosyltransferase